MREEFFSKFIDYNVQLEKILETKDFSKEAKNLLLSMLYKIDLSYTDYQTVKRQVKNKQGFLEDILRIVENCESIELVKPNSEEGKKFIKEGIKYKVSPLTYEIKSFENEKVILEALFELDTTPFYLPEKYNLIRVALPELLEEGKAINNVEIIRDFNAWSWNVLPNEIHNFYANIIYQNLAFLIGQEELEDCLINDEIENKIEWITTELLEENSKEEVSKFLTLIYQIAVDSCVNQNPIEKTRLWDEKTSLKEEYDKLMNKEKYLEEITQRKKDKNKEIEIMDRLLNDRKLLEQEYKVRNQSRKEYNKILNLEHLVEMIERQRKKAIREIEECNHLLQPKQYLETLEEIKESLNLLEDIEENEISHQTIEGKMVRIEKIFFIFFKEKMKQASKKEMIDFIYKIRYYEQIPFNVKEKMGQHKELKSLFQEIEEFAINKLYEQKQVNKIAEDKSFNFKIVREIFHTKMIDLENSYMKLIAKENQYQLEIYDKEVLEKEVILKEDTKELKEFKVKNNKMMKVFV